MPIRVVISIVVSLWVCSVHAEEIRFNRDIRPILAANCYHCHGPDQDNREADLRLDRADGIADAFGKGLADSEAWLRIIADDDDMRMPPVDSHRELEPVEIEALKAWIESGAPWEGHWSFIPPTRPDVPRLPDESRVVNPIDAFIQSRLAAAGQMPAEQADRERLIRRVTFDLTGLPPTIAEIDAFLADTSDRAYERVVDRILNSPHFGERMAVAWMDAARYGDTSVFHGDGHRDMWLWRDYVIDAYNDNLSFADFTREQLAGDLIPNASLQQQVASGFLRNNATTDEGGAIAEEFRVEYAVDRVKTTSLVWLGLTMECAQCHDHKYDPISQREYYQFYAYFNQASDPGMQTRNGNQAPIAQVPDGAQLARAKRLKTRLPGLSQRVADAKSAALRKYPVWRKEIQSKGLTAPTPPTDIAFHATLNRPSDGSDPSSVANLTLNGQLGRIHGTVKWASGYLLEAIRFEGKTFIDFGDVAGLERDMAFSYGAWIKLDKKAEGAVLARMDDSHGHRGYDLMVNDRRAEVHIVHQWPGNAVKVKTKERVLSSEKWQHLMATYDGSSKAAGVKVFVDGKEQELVTERDGLTDTIRTDVPLHIGQRKAGSPIESVIDDVRIYARALSAAEVRTLAEDSPLRPILAIRASERTKAQKEQLQNHYLDHVDQPYKAARVERQAILDQIAALEKPVSSVMVMKDVDAPRMTFVLDRGNYNSPQKDNPVKPGTLRTLPPLPTAPGTRLGLADWLLQSSNPLTSRVAVNRYWNLMFGAGIVETVEDFGSQGDWPSHPELLDFLAVDFRESGWDVKRMLKMMVMSWTYRQSSAVTSELLDLDPKNRLLARGPRFRLQAEFIRDNALATSGLLVPLIGGPSVKPYQPEGLWNEVSINTSLRFTQDHGDKIYRRGMYTYWKRSAPMPSLAIFGTPTRDKCTLQRARTNTPLQALVTLNDVQYVEAARALAERAWNEGGDNLTSRIQYAYRLATGRRPSRFAVEQLMRAFADERQVFSTATTRAKELLTAGESARDETIEAADHAAMTIVASIILNLDETLTRG